MALPVPNGYEPLDKSGVRRWLATAPSLAARLGGRPDDWRISEVSDGNLNVVYAVTGPAGGVCVKQSLPYVRVAGESWPMPLDRAYFEQLHFGATGAHVDGLAPRLYHYDPQRYAIAMELLPTHLILRRGLVEGRRYPQAVARIAEFAARSTFATSVFAQPFEQVNARLAAFAGNLALTRITVDLIFTHPYVVNERNRWTAPHLDATVRGIRDDADLKAAAARLGHRFLTKHEALLHGDLHTGSVMVNDTDTRVIDAEFAIYGPIGFDLGLFIGNLLTAYFSFPGHAGTAAAQPAHGEWLLGELEVFWQTFRRHFETQWRAVRAGDGFPSALFSSNADELAVALERDRWFEELRLDTLGYAGAEIIRRIVGFAHNLEFESIADAGVRARLERRALGLARRLVVAPGEFRDFGALAASARQLATAAETP